MAADAGDHGGRAIPPDPVLPALHEGERLGPNHLDGQRARKCREPQQICLYCRQAWRPGPDPGRYVWTPLVENQIPDTMRTRGLTREQVLNDVLLAAIPQRKFVMPDQVAAMAVFLCTEGASAITGANLAVDGGWTTQ